MRNTETWNKIEEAEKQLAHIRELLDEAIAEQENTIKAIEDVLEDKTISVMDRIKLTDMLIGLNNNLIIYRTKEMEWLQAKNTLEAQKQFQKFLDGDD